MKCLCLNTALLCCLLLCGGLYAVAQAPGGHPPGPPPGGHAPGGPPGPPPSAGPASGGNNAGPNNSVPGSGTGTVTTRSGIKLGPSGRWWDNRSTTQAVGVSRAQQRKLDAIFDANKPEIIRTYLEFEKQQAALDALSKSPTVDKSRMFAAIDAVNQARASLEKANTQMLLQIRAQLSPSQLAKLDSLP